MSKQTKTFNNLCWQLNNLDLADEVAELRKAVAAKLGTERRDYDKPEQVGWQGWLESPVGVVAFVALDDSIVWRW